MTIYHYCSNHVFHSIITNGTLRLSSMTLSNDTEEGVWTLKLLREACNALTSNTYEDDEFNPWHVERVFEALDAIRRNFDGLGLCFSRKGDMLSQWRGYADDGQGVSIGFSESGLRSWAATKAELMHQVELVEVVYDKDRALAELQDLAQEIEAHALKGAFNDQIGSLLRNAGKSEAEIQAEADRIKSAYWTFSEAVIPRIIADLYRYKNPAFDEELEWRLLTSLLPGIPDRFDIHPGRSVLKPFRTYPIEDENRSMITDVVIGPKNTTPETIVKAFLRQNKCAHVEVRRSVSTYR